MQLSNFFVLYSSTHSFSKGLKVWKTFSLQLLYSSANAVLY